VGVHLDVRPTLKTVKIKKLPNLLKLYQKQNKVATTVENS
jgi:hypothetical protein